MRPDGVAKLLTDRLYGGASPFTHADRSYVDHSFPFTNLTEGLIDRFLDECSPKLWVEVGTMHGGSAIRVADCIKRKGLSTEIVCIDSFTGDVNMWLNEYEHRFMHLERGRPTIWERFLANVATAEHEDIIVPIYATSAVGLKILRRLEIQADVAYLDSAHESGETYLEAENCWAIIRKGGVLLGDDWNWPAVASDIRRFCDDHMFVGEMAVDGAQWWIAHS